MKLPTKHSVERKLILFFLINFVILSSTISIFLLSIILNCAAMNIIPILIMIFYVPSVIYHLDGYIKKSYFRILFAYIKGNPIKHVIPKINRKNNSDIFGKTVLEEIRIDLMEGVIVSRDVDVTYIIVPSNLYINVIKNRDSYYIDTYQTIVILEESDMVNKSITPEYRDISINITDEKLLNKIKLMK